MTNNEILLTYMPVLDEIFNKLCCDEDLRQMVYLIILEKDNKLLNDLHERGELRYWLSKIVKMQKTGKRSEYNRLYTDFTNRTTTINEDICGDD